MAHSLQWEGIWRELSCVDRGTSFAVRQQCGHTLKSAVKHILTVDRRDNPIFPGEGSLFKLSQVRKKVQVLLLIKENLRDKLESRDTNSWKDLLTYYLG